MSGEKGKAGTGVWGFDEVLAGGFSRGHVYLLEGVPGTGKTTLALHFLLAGAKENERCLYMALSETAEELRQGAASHHWTIGDNIEVVVVGVDGNQVQLGIVAPPELPIQRKESPPTPPSGARAPSRPKR